MESIAFLNSTAATHMSVPHSLLFWETSLCVIMWSVFLDPVWSGHWFKLVGTLGEEFVKLWKTTDRPAALGICHVTFLVDNCDHTLFYVLGAMEFCLMIHLKISCAIVIVSSSAPLISSALIPLLSADFPFLRLSIAVIFLAR